MPENSEIHFLEGPHSRWEEFKFTCKVFFQFIKGFRALHFTGPCVTIFGSARFKPDHPFYLKTEELAAAVARLGFTIITGGGPGLMEAANKGAKSTGGKSVGCNIVLPKEQRPNPYLDKNVNIEYFFVRKTLLIKYSYAFIVMPGGFGTMDEFFEALTLIQTKKISDFPVIIFCKEFHEKLLAYLHNMEQSHTIDVKDLDLFFYTDSIPDAIGILQEKCIAKYGLKPHVHKASWWLFEKPVKPAQPAG